MATVNVALGGSTLLTTVGRPHLTSVSTYSRNVWTALWRGNRGRPRLGSGPAISGVPRAPVCREAEPAPLGRCFVLMLASRRRDRPRRKRCPCNQTDRNRG